ncbi:hypothetical protein A0H81_02059 [Grifola frondosa]|uniref:Uncharacterized protein n=1 Tax=Grifola frondosa TaxID=5627 RepID=A0A1C7MM08_GRIFR|nr:hypothetical protein A0H81_02059 [Grifola frondosa]
MRCKFSLAPAHASKLLHSFTPSSSRISSATPPSPDVDMTTPMQGKGGNWTLSEGFSSGPKHRAFPYGWPASRLHGHDGHTVSSPIPFGKMIFGEKNPYDTFSSPVRPPAAPIWSPPRSQERAMRTPPLLPSAYIYRSAADCSDARPAPPLHLITNDDTSHLHIAYTTKTPVIKKLISNPPRLARALSPPSQPLKRDAYAALNSPDSSWSSLPNTKKARTTKAKAAATAQSGKFKLPTSLVGRTKVAQLTRNNLDEGR